ncbi:hypothetical protein CBS101457_006642 [Exobasidium rhododendri]|nr:hypothetical protein CBS101457_006642 [Exobasidium rhododendri]
MQTNYTSSYLQDGSSTQTTPFSDPYGPPPTNPNQGNVELNLSGWSSQNPTLQQLHAPVRHGQQVQLHHTQQHQQQQQQRHSSQRASAASTLTSMARHRDTGELTNSADTGKKRLQTKGSKENTSKKGPTNSAGQETTKRLPAQPSIIALQAGSDRLQKGNGLISSAFLVQKDVEEAERDEVGAGGGVGRGVAGVAGGGGSSTSTLGGTYSSQGNKNTTLSSYTSSLPPPAVTSHEVLDVREGSGTIRKQNSACDACRNRKVRCNRVAGDAKCVHCTSKSIECTTHFVQMASTSAKRPTKRPRPSADGGTESGASAHLDADGMSILIKYLILQDADYANSVQGLTSEIDGYRPSPSTVAEARLANASARFDFVSDLIETYFSIVHIRYPILDPVEFRQRFHSPSTESGGPPADVLIAVMMAWGAKFSENPIILADRKEAAHELTPLQKKKREAASLPTTTAKIATAAPVNRGKGGTGTGGGRGKPSASNYSVPTTTKQEAHRVIGRSPIAEDLVVKAQEVLDRNKVHRLATLDHARAALIVQALFWQQAPETESGFDELLPSELRPRKRRGLFICNGVWVLCAISHLQELRVNQQETISKITDVGQRSQVAMCWWLACMMDAHMSAFYRRKPHLALEDYTTDLSAPLPAAEQQGPHPLAASQAAYMIWLRSAQQQVEMMRMVYDTLWTPYSATIGISAKKLERLASMAFSWRENHLASVGAPSPIWPSHWNFADAVTACSSDLNYHIVWILMWEAIEEFGIAELKATTLPAYQAAALRYQQQQQQGQGGRGVDSNSGSLASTTTAAEMEMDQSKIRGLRSRIYDEALNGALRSANLIQVLCDNGYLRLEPGIMKWAMSEAGFCLTRFKRPEVSSIIDGLRQYGQAFEECYAQANELENLSSEYLQQENGGGSGGGGGGMVMPSSLNGGSSLLSSAYSNNNNNNNNNNSTPNHSVGAGNNDLSHDHSAVFDYYPPAPAYPPASEYPPAPAPASAAPPSGLTYASSHNRGGPASVSSHGHASSYHHQDMPQQHTIPPHFAPQDMAGFSSLQQQNSFF